MNSSNSFPTPVPNFITSPTELFNSMRIPDVRRFMPYYDGEPYIIHEFCNGVEEVMLMSRSQ